MKSKKTKTGKQLLAKFYASQERDIAYSERHLKFIRARLQRVKGCKVLQAHKIWLMQQERLHSEV